MPGPLGGGTPVWRCQFLNVVSLRREPVLVGDAINRYALGGRDPLQYNEDGSFGLHIQKKSPDAGKGSNWLPSPDGDFLLMMRLHWPKEIPPSILDGTWQTPPVEAMH